MMAMQMQRRAALLPARRVAAVPVPRAAVVGRRAMVVVNSAIAPTPNSNEVSSSG